MQTESIIQFHPITAIAWLVAIMLAGVFIYCVACFCQLIASRPAENLPNVEPTDAEIEAMIAHAIGVRAADIRKLIQDI